MPKPGPPYSPEFRAEAVRLLRSSGKTVAELSRELGVSEQTLRRWRLQTEDDRGQAPGLTTDERSRLQELERENRLLREERDSLRKGRSTAPPPPRLNPLDVPRGRGQPPPVTPNSQGKDRSVRTLARLTAEVIEVGVAVVTVPAKWAVKGLRWFGDQRDEPPGTASEERDGKRPVAAD
jgi:transposase